MSTFRVIQGDGGRPPLTPEERAMVTVSLPFVESEAKRVKRRCWPWARVHVEDLIGPGTEALMDAVRIYRPERNTSLEHYARAHVRGRMLDAVRTEHLPLHARVEYAMDREEAAIAEHLIVQADLFLDEEAVLEQGMKAACDEVMTAVVVSGLAEALRPSAEDEVLALEEYREALVVFSEALKALAPELRDVVLRVHRDRQSLEQVRVELGIHHNTAKRRHQRALDALRRMLAKGGVEHAPECVEASFPSLFRPDD